MLKGEISNSLEVNNTGYVRIVVWILRFADERWNTKKKNNNHGVLYAKLGNDQGWKAPAAQEGKRGVGSLFDH